MAGKRSAPWFSGELHPATTVVAANSIHHGGGQGTLCTRSEDHRLVCEFRGAGRIAGPLVGRVRPGPTPVGGLTSARYGWLPSSSPRPRRASQAWAAIMARYQW
ncbi:hypothetical protein ACF1GW_34645 [Streptomyces achromogenes]|uniref:hypothetical protein n=1 Tax=Streptomyces achromogenes TaxID=67255 RepID=UPI0037024AE8